MLAAVAALTGCVNLSFGEDGKAQAQYVLSDATPKAERRSAPIQRRLLVAPVTASSTGETFAIAYSRAEHQRAYYQFASWSDRPTSRFAYLLVDRIEARGMFSSVAVLGNSVGGDLLLNVSVLDLVHDVQAAAGRIEVQAELIERRGRRLVERRRFSASAPVAQENSQAATVALSRAATTVIDQIVPWLERASEALPPPAPR
jgi:cholesterol transport system auxiliary component